MKKFACALLASSLLAASPAVAGPFIIDGTDADDHGSNNGVANVQGWLYIQRALENISASSSLTQMQKSIAVLGSNVGTQAGNAASSAVSFSSTLSGAGWTVNFVEGATAINEFFANTSSTYNSTDASVLYMDSGINNVSGGIDFNEQAAIDGNASAINNFLGSGGGLFSMAQGYGWLSTLIPGLTVIPGGNTGINLTSAGMAAFPGLTSADLSAGPYHATFSNTGSLPILGIGQNDGGQAVILGAAGGSITAPTVPEASTWAMLILGFMTTGAAMRSRKSRPALRYV